MNSTQFGYMNIKDQVEYFNSLMKHENSIKDVCRIIGLSQGSLKKRFTYYNYIYCKDQKKYVLSTEESLLLYDNNSLIPEDASEELNIIKTKMLGLTESFEDIQEMVAWYKSGGANRNNIIEVVEGIKIQLPEDADPSYRTTIRVNKTVYDSFQEFCKDNEEFKAKDLLSQALLDFIARHK